MGEEVLLSVIRRVVGEVDWLDLVTMEGRTAQEETVPDDVSLRGLISILADSAEADEGVSGTSSTYSFLCPTSCIRNHQVFHLTYNWLHLPP